jgi:hypothetical protein
MKVLRIFSYVIMLGLMIAMILRMTPIPGLSTAKLVVIGHILGWMVGTVYVHRYSSEDLGDLPGIVMIILTCLVTVSREHTLHLLLVMLTVIPVMACFRWIQRGIHFVDEPREKTPKFQFSHGRHS